jgi:dCMP deaminase
MKANKEYKRPNWDEIFMAHAFLAATRSSCIHLHTGCVVVKDHRILSSGYNGAPPGVENCLERGCRKDKFNIEFNQKGTGTCRGVHAEINAMSQIARKDLNDTVIYSVFFPCSACAKAIVGSGIKEVVFTKMYAEPDTLTRELFAEAGVKLRKMPINMNKISELILNIDNQKGF